MWSLRFSLLISLTVIVSGEIFSLDNFLINSFLTKKRDASTVFSYGANDVRGSSNWVSISSHCEGLRQSPINIVTQNPNPSKQSYTFNIGGYKEVPVSITTTNNGHGLAMKLNYVNKNLVFFEGGPLQGRYIVDNIHWHWGDNNQEGSEHTIDGKRFAAEGHIVAYNSKYANVETAMPEPDGLAVLGILYEVGKKKKEPVTTLIHY